MALSVSTRVPIADLSPGISVSDSVIHGIVTLVWPYSSVNQTFSFLLVEPDFRLRRQRGQVRISLRDSCARRVTRAGLVSGDEIYLAVDGAQWQKDKTTMSTPGRGIEWELLYVDHIRFEKVLENGENSIVDTSRMILSPDLPPSSLSPSTLPTVPSSVQAQSTPRMAPQVGGAFSTWSSPMFIKEKRLPDIFPLGSDPEVFYEEEEEWSSGPPAKKLKFGRKSDQWHFVRRSASPEAGPEFQTTSKFVEKPHTPDSTSPTAEQSIQEPRAAILNGDVSAHPVTGNKSQTGTPDTEIDQESIPIQSVPENGAVFVGNDIISQSSPLQVIDQELDSSIIQSIIQDTPITEAAENLSDPYPVLDVFSEPSLETATDLITTMPEQDRGVMEIMHSQEDHMLNTQGKSLNLPRSPSPAVNLLPISQRRTSKTPEPHLEINIQSSTPLVQPTSLESFPITPRLQPLPSPGLDLVSPIDQRHPIQVGGYFACREVVEVKLTSSLQASGASAPVIQEVQTLETQVSDTGGLRESESEKQLIDKPQTTEDTFFNRLLARYDEGTDQNSQPVIDQAVSSPIPPDDPSKEHHADAQRMPTSSVSDNAVSIDQSLEATAIDDHQDSRVGLKEAQNDGTTEISKDAFEPEEGIEVESENSSDDNNTIIGKWHDATHKPLQETPNTASSPLLTQHAESLQSDNSSNVEGLVEASSHPVSIVAIPQNHRTTQDTRFPEDSHRDSKTPTEAENTDDVEVVDLLDSDSSPISAALEDQASPTSEHKENDLAAEFLEDDYNTPSIVSPPSPNTISKLNREETSTITSINHNDRDEDPIETQHQEFYTAPPGFEDAAGEDTMGLTEITNGDAEDYSTDLLEHVDSASTIQETPEKQISPVPESVPEDSRRKTRSSQRTTRSQNQQTAETVTSKDESTSEQPENMSAAKYNQADSADLAAQGFRTANDYYSTLARLSDFHNQLTSLLAVVAASSKPIRSTTGPRDFTQSIYLAAPNSQTNNDFTIAQLFRPFSSALPYPLPVGSVILLKNFKVQSYKRKMSLLSTSTSAWAVFDQVSAVNQSEMKVSITGPPVDFGGAERGIAWGLGKWWTSLEYDVQNKITSVANTAKNQAEAELEKKAASARKTRDTKASQSQLHLQTPSRRQTRSSQSQDQMSIPNTPSTRAATPSPTHRRTRSGQYATTLTPTKAQHNLRSGLAYSDNETGQERESIESEDNAKITETDQSERPMTSQSQRSSGRATATVDNEPSQGNVKTRAQSRKDAAKGTSKKTRAEKALWHELRDGAVYKD